MNIVFDAREIRSSGIGVYIQNVVVQLVRSGVLLTLLCRKTDAEFFVTFKKQVEIKYFDAALYSVKELLLLPFKTVGSQIFWSPHYNVPLMNFTSRLAVATVHDVYHLAYHNTLTTSQKIYAKLMINRAVASKVVLTVSHFSKDEIIKYTRSSGENIHVIYNGINFDVFNQIFSEEVREQVLNKYLVSMPYILFVGNIKPHKNLKNALLGFRHFVNSSNSLGKELKFVIVGKREGFITADNKISELLSDSFYKTRVLFTGWVSNEDLPVLYQQASAFIFPSIYEGFGFPALEAMAAGCPVISSNAACMPEVYEDAAEYFDPLQPEAIAEAMAKVLGDSQLKKSLIEKGFVQARKYSWNNAVKQKMAIIKQFA